MGHSGTSNTILTIYESGKNSHELLSNQTNKVSVFTKQTFLMSTQDKRPPYRFPCESYASTWSD